MKATLRHVSVLFLSLFAALAFAQFPLTVSDDLGRSITLDAAPERIVSMLASNTEIACALSACDLLVGIDQFSNYPPEVMDLPRLGSAFTPNLEALVALEPDLVLVDEDSGIAASLDALGIPNVAFTGQSLEELFISIRSIGTVLGRTEPATELVERLRTELNQVEEVTAGLESPTVFFELDATPYSVGPGSYVDELITLAGGSNIIGDGFGPFPQVDPEFVVAAAPEVVILADAPFGITTEVVSARPGWAQIPAVTSERVVELNQEEIDMLNRPGPRVAEGVRLLARIFHPDQF